MKSKLALVRNRTMSSTVAALGLFGALVGTASAQAENAGIEGIITAIEGLGPDMTLVVAAAIVIALIGLGAGIALSVGKKLIGRG